MDCRGKFAMSTKRTDLSGSSSLERLIPDEIREGEATGEETMKLHIARYEWAASIIGADERTSRVLDAACGAGYGSAILAGCKPEIDVTGADIDGAAVAYARERYGASGARYEHIEILKLSSDFCFDAIVSLETIEHVSNPIATIEKFRLLLRRHGLLILSVPITPSVDVNPYHLTDFTARSIRGILRSAKFDVIDELEQIQAFSPIKILSKQESRLDDMRENLVQYYLTHPVSAFKRAYATLRFGFTNRYLTLACRKLD